MEPPFSLIAGNQGSHQLEAPFDLNAMKAEGFKCQ
jgi:hypothetical protein